MDQKVLIAKFPSRPNLDAFFGPRGWQGMVANMTSSLSGQLCLIINHKGEDVLLTTDIPYRQVPACQRRATEQAAEVISGRAS